MITCLLTRWKLGDEVVFATPKGERRLTIEKIEVA